MNIKIDVMKMDYDVERTDSFCGSSNEKSFHSPHQIMDPTVLSIRMTRKRKRIIEDIDFDRSTKRRKKIDVCNQ